MASADQRVIMVVEDDAGVRNLLRDVLVERGFVVVSAEHGAEALDILKCGPRPSLILLDMVMPVMGGEHFLELLRARDELKQIPVLVTSAENQQPSAAQGFLGKPFDLPQLFEAIGALLPLESWPMRAPPENSRLPNRFCSPQKENRNARMKCFPPDCPTPRYKERSKSRRAAAAKGRIHRAKLTLRRQLASTEGGNTRAGSSWSSRPSDSKKSVKRYC